MKFPKSFDIKEIHTEAMASHRNRHALIMHSPGDELNKVFNYMLKNSYMQPHRHPGTEKVEHISIVEGLVKVIFFDDFGNILGTKQLREKEQNTVVIPAYSWHTYVILSEYAITYETMMGVYDPLTWKEMAHWAPKEQNDKAFLYLQSLMAA